MGPLSGVKIIELGGIGPGPFCGMLLADMGADVLRIERMVASDSGVKGMDPRFSLLHRGRPVVAMDLKAGDALAAVKKMITHADALTEGFRPGVAERLGLGPADCLALNPRLVYGRVTGWGQDGPLALTPGHDINYIALTGALNAIGRRDGPPVPPLNLVGDFGGGALYLAFGVVCALLEARTSGQGQVVDAAMVDGAASLMTMMYGMYADQRWSDKRGDNRLDSGTPWYDVYETRDGLWVSVGANEPRFYAELVKRLGLETLPDRDERANWPLIRASFTSVFKTRTRDEWTALLADSEACFAPVLSMAEAPSHPHNVARGTFVAVDGIVQPAPAPRFSRTPAAIRGAPPAAGGHAADALLSWGFTAAEIAALRASGAVA
jgi:alpha-methylacyl-CoA racemase